MGHVTVSFVGSRGPCAVHLDHTTYQYLWTPDPGWTRSQTCEQTDDKLEIKDDPNHFWTLPVLHAVTDIAERIGSLLHDSDVEGVR